MSASLQTNSTNDIKRLFASNYPLPYILLLTILIFNSFRPDKLLPGGSIILYIPTVVLLLLLVIWIQTSQKAISNAQTKLFIGFIVVMALGVLLARNPSRAFILLRNIFFYSFILYLVTVQFLDTSFKVEKYIRLFLVLSLFIGFMGIVGKGSLPVPILADENDFALFMNILIPIGFFLGQEATEKWKKVFYYSVTIVFIVGTVASFSRGGFVGLLAVSIFLFIKSKQKIAALVLLVIFASSIVIFAPASYWEEMETINTEGAQEGTGRERIESWKAGFWMFLDNPIIGVGPENFGIWFPEYYVQYASKEPARMWGRAAHSLYFTLLAETGLAGTLLFFLMLWKNYNDYKYITNLEKIKERLLMQADLTKEDCDLISSGIRTQYHLSLGYSGAMIGFLTTGAFISVLWYPYFWMLTSFWVMTSNVARNIERVLYERSRSEISPIEPHPLKAGGFAMRGRQDWR